MRRILMGPSSPTASGWHSLPPTLTTRSERLQQQVINTQEHLHTPPPGEKPWEQLWTPLLQPGAGDRFPDAGATRRLRAAPATFQTSELSRH